MVDKFTIELDEQFLKKMFKLTNTEFTGDQEVTLLMLKKQLGEIETLLIETKSAAQSKPASHQKTSSSTAASDSFQNKSGQDTFNLPKKNILIIDDLGVITYQLSVMFEKMGYNTVQSKEIYDAIEKFKKQNFDLVIMDLFIPTEREGFILLEELKKTAQLKPKITIIGVMSASGKKEHKQMCKIKGAEFYIEKINDWQKELTAVVQGLI